MENTGLIDKFSPFIKEVRKRLVFSFLVFLVAMFVGFGFYEDIIRFLINILSLKGINIVFTSPFQFINLAIACGVATGLITVFPLLVIEMFSFLKPALKEKEYKMMVRFLPLSLLLFIVGFLFGAYIMKWQIEIFLARSISLGIGNILDISSLLTTVLLTSALMGIGFQFPLALLLLIRTGIIKHDQINKLRKWVYLGSFLFAIVLPPDSIIADVFLSLPLIILFEVTLLLDKAQRKKE